MKAKNEGEQMKLTDAKVQIPFVDGKRIYREGGQAMTEALAKKNEIEVRCGRRPYPNEGELWRHFKGGLYSIVATVQHTENEKWYIVYKAEKTFGKAVKGEVYLRPAVMFMSRTDKRKYPEAEQEYRFEKVEVSEDGHVE